MRLKYFKNPRLAFNDTKNFINESDWVQISIYQELSEDFIREYQNKVHWGWISQEQKLSSSLNNL